MLPSQAAASSPDRARTGIKMRMRSAQEQVFNVQKYCVDELPIKKGQCDISGNEYSWVFLDEAADIRHAWCVLRPHVIDGINRVV